MTTAQELDEILHRHAMAVARGEGGSTLRADLLALATHSPSAAGGDREWPDIGDDPLKGDRSDRYNASAAACRAAYVKQQPHVPNQTALVWRWHLGALLEEHLRLNAILSRDATPSASVPERSGVREARAIIADMVRLADMGFEESLREPQESGNFAAYERAKAYLAATPSASVPRTPRDAAKSWPSWLSASSTWKRGWLQAHAHFGCFSLTPESLADALTFAPEKAADGEVQS